MKIIEIQEEVKIGNTILEKGDKIRIVSENLNYYRNEMKIPFSTDEPEFITAKFKSPSGESKWLNVNKDFFQALDSLRVWLGM